MPTVVKRRTSEGWTCYEDWDFGGFKERLELFMGSVDKTALTRHVGMLTEKKAVMSDAFSAGQYWCCFEIVLDDESLVIARVRLPRHPEANELVDESSEQYAIECEVATMKFVQDHAKAIPAPKLYAYEPRGSEHVMQVGACYMLIEGSYGNTLQDVAFDLCGLPVELAHFSFPTIGSICSYSESSGATIGKLSCGVAENYLTAGPFRTAKDFFLTTAEARYATAHAIVAKTAGEAKATPGKADGEHDEREQELEEETPQVEEEEDDEVWCTLGPFVFLSTVKDTEIFSSFSGNEGPFHLNHMDMGSQNILVDDELNFIAVID